MAGVRLQSQQCLVARQAPAVAGECAALADQAVARHQQGDFVGAVGAGHGTHGFGLAQLRRQLAVAEGAAGRNAAQRLPDFLLKSRARQNQRHAVCGGRVLQSGQHRLCQAGQAGIVLYQL